ncbi:MAG: LLM class flavin-dependent oxidoreductase [Haloferacaceae archaeon]
MGDASGMVSHGYLLPTRGVVFSSQSEAELTARAQADVVGLAERAEAAGFDGAWIGDSVLAKPRFEPLVTLAAVAAATDAMTLGTAVYLPGLRHPVHVAHQTATLDRLAGGRLALGVGVGVRPLERAEAENLDTPFDRRGAHLNEALDVVDRLWRGESVDHDGDFFDLDDASIGFGPHSEIPVYVASAALDPASGFPRTVRERITRFGGGWLPIAVSADTYAAGLDHAREALEAADRDPTAFDPAYYQDVVIADTEAEAMARAREFYTAYYRGDPGHDEEGSVVSDEEIRARGAFGPPETVAAHLDRYRAAGVERFVTRFVTDDQRDQLRRFRELL